MINQELFQEYSDVRTKPKLTDTSDETSSSQASFPAAELAVAAQVADLFTEKSERHVNSLGTDSSTFHFPFSGAAGVVTLFPPSINSRTMSL